LFYESLEPKQWPTLSILTQKSSLSLLRRKNPSFQNLFLAYISEETPMGTIFFCAPGKI
jgi:hypothetical protein